MFLKNILLAGADGAAGGGTAVAEEAPNSIGDFMTGLGQLDTTDSPLVEKKESDGKTTDNAAGSDSASAKQAADAAAAAAVDKSAADANANKLAAEAAAAAAAAKSAAEKTGDKTTDDDKWPRSSSDWDTFKARRKQEREKAQTEIQAREATIAELQGKIKTFEETGAKGTQDNEQVKAFETQIGDLNKTIDDLSNRIRILDVTKHPKWEKHFGEQIKEQTDIATQILGEEKGKKLAEIMGIPDLPGLKDYKKGLMQEFIADLDTYEQGAISSVTVKLMEIERSKQKEIEANQAHVAKLQEQSEGQRKTVMAQREKVFNTVMGSLTDPKTGMPIFQKRDGEGQEQWNAELEKRLGLAKRFFFGAKDIKQEEIATAAAHAAAMPALLSAYNADMAEKNAEIAKLTEQVKRLTAATPGGEKGKDTGTGGGTGAGEGSGARKGAAHNLNLTPEEATKHLIGSWTTAE